MSSFYAGIMAGSIGTSDYNQLKGVPITNIGGETGVVDLSSLKVGHYALKGAYTVSTESSEEINNKSVLDVIVLIDEETTRRVVEFLTYENGEVFFNLFVYEENGELVKQEKLSLNAPSHTSWGEI